MREIKFRVWDKQEHLMFYDNWQEPDMWGSNTYFIKVNLKGIVQIYIDDDSGKSGLHEHNIQEYHDRFDLMQYTGLKDKNGVEIYEGDIIQGNIIKYSPLQTMGNIVYDVEWASYANKNLAGNTLLREINQIDVIGNIYENGDLIN